MTRRRAVIVGGSRGIGAGIAQALAPTYDLAVIHRTASAAATALGQELAKGGGQVLDVIADVTDLAAAATAMADAISRLGGVEVVVFSASAPLQPAPLRKVAATDIAAQLQLAVQTPLTMLQTAFPHLCEAAAPAVAFVLSSVVVSQPPSQWGAYAVAKHAALGLMRSLAGEWASRGIRVNAVAPSLVPTDFTAALPPQFAELVAERTPLRRLATPADVGAAVRYLVSAEAGFVTGVNLPGTGGNN